MQNGKRVTAQPNKSGGQTIEVLKMAPKCRVSVCVPECVCVCVCVCVYTLRWSAPMVCLKSALPDQWPRQMNLLCSAVCACVCVCYLCVRVCVCYVCVSVCAISTSAVAIPFPILLFWQLSLKKRNSPSLMTK